jgi:hypothetical protein
VKTGLIAKDCKAVVLVGHYNAESCPVFSVLVSAPSNNTVSTNAWPSRPNVRPTTTILAAHQRTVTGGIGRVAGTLQMQRGVGQGIFGIDAGMDREE